VTRRSWLLVAQVLGGVAFVYVVLLVLGFTASVTP
jgi:hypothetical protein